MVGVQAQLSLLVQLQQLDRVMDDLSDQQLAIPEEIQKYRETLTQQQQASLEKKKEIENLQKSRRQAELDVEAKNTELKKLNAQLFDVKTNKEYQAMQTQINECKAAKAKFEDDVLQAMMKEDETKKELTQVELQFKEFEKVFQTQERTLKAQLTEIEQAAAVKKTERQALTQQVEAKVLAVYERVRKNKDRVAIAQVQGSICGECHMLLRPQVIIELSKQEGLVYCDSCSRILYV